MIIDNTKVKADEKEFSTAELEYYVKLAKSRCPKEEIVSLEVTLADDGRINLRYEKHGEKFERIRRITGM